MSRRHGRRAKPQFHRLTSPGAAPGEVTVDPMARPPEIDVIAYSATDIVREHKVSVARIAELRKQFPVVWINVVGLGDANVIRQLGKMFNIHPLALEDVVHVHQRPKLEPYQEQLFIVTRMLTFADDVSSEQLSLFLGEGYVLTFIEDPGDVFELVRIRLRASSGHIRSSSAGYLAYALLDAVIDAHFPVLEKLGDRLEALEDRLVYKPDRSIVGQIHDIKRHLRLLRREMWPLREVCSQLNRDRFPWIGDEVRLYLRDCYDHTVQIIDLVETYRELGADLNDLYLSSQSNYMNEIMKVLTIITTIFMPLSFIAGLYGMNMPIPENHYAITYPIVLGVMVLLAVGMFWFFWRKGWLAKSSLPVPNDVTLDEG